MSPATVSISMGATQQFTATAKYSDGSTANVSSTVTWTVGSSSIATIKASGLLTAVASGSTTVTASLSGTTGSASLDVETVTVTKTLTSISVTPPTASINIGANQQYTATGKYSDGSTGSVAVTWSTSSASIATINSSGLATGVAAGSITVTATSGSVSGTAALTVNAEVVTAISVTPTSVSLTVGGTEQFTATATYSNGSSGNVTSSATWSSTNSSVATVKAGFAIAVGAGTAGVTASLNGFSSSATVTVSSSTSTGVNIPTYHVDQNRSGANLNETTLTPANVTVSSFGKLFSYLVDGYVYGQPLLVSNLTMGDGSTHNVLFAATENDSVYAFDADSNAGTNAGLLWQTSLLQSGESAVTNGPIQPVEGVTSTPAIDTATNTMYVVSTQTSTGAGATFRLSALDITTGAQKYGGPVTITAQYPGTNSDSINGIIYLTTACLQRAALLVAYGSVYIGFGSCHSGWLLAYDETTLAQTGVFNMSPNLDGEGTYGGAGGVWMGGGGPAADGNGYVYVSTGNGPYSASEASYGDSIVKFNSTLQFQDYFTPYVYGYMDCQDADLAAGGLLLIPASGNTPMQALAGGKTGKMYLVDTDDLGQEQNNDTGATQTLWFDQDLATPYEASCTGTSESGSADINSYEIFGTATFFNNSVFLGVTPTGSVPTPVRQFVYSPGSAQPLTPSDVNYTGIPYIQEGSYGTTPFISANATSNGVLWMIDHGNPLQNSGGASPTSAILRAYNPNDLNGAELYDSSMNSGDAPGYGIKFTSPIVANGKAYISTAHDPTTVPNPQGELDVYGLK
ncbi:MAG TPA: Ig-like domain-containing protein [Candidatus Aquilonibacter sp.]|nr:Ig-like domain-containing protein [Candidatus Aquilonibacter sp.]